VIKISEDVVFSHIAGPADEVDQVRELLTFPPDSLDEEDKGHEFLREKNNFYSGLIPFIERSLPHIEFEVKPVYDKIDIPFSEINIPSDYIKNGNSYYQDRKYQLTAARKAIAKGRGLLELPTGSGKTSIAAMITKWLIEHGYVGKVYIVAGTRFLARQAHSRFISHGLSKIGLLAGGEEFEPAQIQVCVVNSLVQKLKQGDPAICGDFLQADLVFWDEVHHLSAITWAMIGEVCRAPFRYGLTATAWDDPMVYSGEDLYLLGLVGDVCAKVSSKYLRERGYLAEVAVAISAITKPRVYSKYWQGAYVQGIVKHPERMRQTILIARALYRGGYKTLLFVDRIDHGKRLLRELVDVDCIFVKGDDQVIRYYSGSGYDIRRIHDMPEFMSNYLAEHAGCVVIGSAKVVDEGIDVPAFNALIMGVGMKKHRRTVQRVGRGMRPKEGDNRVFVFDFLDAHSPMLKRHSLQRIQTYNLEDYTFAESFEALGEDMGVQFEL
jgi:superfamily II DNA or RNA helicase